MENRKEKNLKLNNNYFLASFLFLFFAGLFFSSGVFIVTAAECNWNEVYLYDQINDLWNPVSSVDNGWNFSPTNCDVTVRWSQSGGNVLRLCGYQILQGPGAHSWDPIDSGAWLPPGEETSLAWCDGLNNGNSTDDERRRSTPMYIDINNPPIADCYIGGEETCLFAVYAINSGGIESMYGASFDIAQRPETPDDFNIAFDACGRHRTYLPTFVWDYDHLGGFQQQAFQIRIATNNLFDKDSDDNPIFDPSVEFVFDGDLVDLQQCTMNSFVSPPGTNSFTMGSPILTQWRSWLVGKWDQTIYWTVRTKDAHVWSRWSDVQEFLLPPHSYPWKDFTWDPDGGAPAGTEITFSPFSVPFGRSPTEVFDAALPQSAWDITWGFPSGNFDFVPPYDEKSHEPIIIFDPPGQYNVKLTVTDHTVDPNQALADSDPTVTITPNTFSIGGVMSCDITLGPVVITWRLPKYREVSSAL